MYVRYAMQDQQAEAGTNSCSPYDGFDTGYLNKNHNILASLTKVYGSTFTTQTKVTWNRLLGDQPLNGDYQPTLYMNPDDAGEPAGIQHRVSRVPALQPRQRHSVRRSAEAAAALSGSDLDSRQARHPVRRVVRAHRRRSDLRGVRQRRRSPQHDVGGAAGARQLRARPASPLPDRDQSRKATRAAPTRRRSACQASPASTATTSSPCMRTTTGASATASRVNLGLRYEYYGPQTKSEPKFDSNFYYGDAERVGQHQLAGRHRPRHRDRRAAPDQREPDRRAVEVGLEQLGAAPRLCLGRDRRRPHQRARRLRHGLRAQLRQRHLQRPVQPAQVPGRLD